MDATTPTEADARSSTEERASVIRGQLSWLDDEGNPVDPDTCDELIITGPAMEVLRCVASFLQLRDWIGTSPI